MIPAKFDYVRPGSLDEAVSALAGGGDDAKVIAGGQSLLPLLRLRLAYPELLVDVGGLDGPPDPFGGAGHLDVVDAQRP